MKRFISILFWLILFLILIASSNYFINKNAYLGLYNLTDILIAHLWVLSFCLLLLNWQFKNKRYVNLFKLFVWILLLVVVLSAVSELLIYKFSNVAFVEQTFLHLEFESLWVGVKVSPFKYTLSIVLSIVLVTLWIKFKPTIKLTINQFLTLLFILLSASTFININGTAAGRLIAGYSDFLNKQDLISISAEDVEEFKQFGVHPVYQDVSKIKAEFSDQPKNLIIVYLESFSHVFVNNERYPNLTPHIEQLIKQHGELTNYHSTAKFTIQGMISSLCGLLPKLTSGNNLSADQIPYQNLPCLPDVLNALDFHQEFFGGARKTFANKEAFLLSKNYDRVWGWLDYKKSTDYVTNDWGLQDSDLFNTAFKQITTLAQKKKPFNLNLLTLATHLNGNPDPICPKYSNPMGENNKFLDGIHCTDYLLGRFISKLDSSHILDDTTIFVTADHGVFNVPIIKDLFGSDIDVHQLFGLLINGHEFDKSLPIGLYDMPAILLDALNITTNINFINGISPSMIKPNRFILRESDMISSIKIDGECNENSNISRPFDKCEIDQLVNISWQHAASFSTNNLAENGSKSVFNISASPKKNNSHIIINDTKQINLFLKEGYPISQNERKYHNHIYLLVYDVRNQQIIERSAYRFESKYVDYFKEAQIRHKNNENVIFIIVSEGSQQNNDNKAWNKLFSQLGNQLFNFPSHAYIGILTYKNGKPHIENWQSNNNSAINITIEDISKYK